MDVTGLRISELNLSRRTIGLLERHNFHTLGEVLSVTESDLLAIRGLGQSTVTELKQAALQALRGDSADGTAPTPEEIAERCAEIQATWKPHEWRRRAGGLVVDRAELPVWL